MVLPLKIIQSEKLKKILIIIGVILIGVLCISIVYFSFQKSLPKVYSSQIANPASVYCEESGGILQIRINENGQYGVCIKGEKECEEWAFYRNECSLE